jgi:MFS family permease
VPNAAQALGVVFAGLIMNRIGRRYTNFAMCAWAIMGAILMITAKTRAQLMAARFINYIYYGAGVVVNSAYIAEIVPEQIRGMAVGAYYVSFVSVHLVCQLLLLILADIRRPHHVWNPSRHRYHSKQPVLANSSMCIYLGFKDPSHHHSFASGSLCLSSAVSQHTG